MFSSMFELGERQSEPCPQMLARLGGFFGWVKGYPISSFMRIARPARKIINPHKIV